MDLVEEEFEEILGVFGLCLMFIFGLEYDYLLLLVIVMLILEKV